MTSQHRKNTRKGSIEAKTRTDKPAKGLKKGTMTAVPPGREPQNLVSPQENPWITSLSQNTWRPKGRKED